MAIPIRLEGKYGIPSVPSSRGALINGIVKANRMGVVPCIQYYREGPEPIGVGRIGAILEAANVRV